MGLHPFTTYVLRTYYQATGWNEDNSYANLTRSSDAILDFAVPKGLQFTISKAPNAMFRTTYGMNVLPRLEGSVGYIFTSCNLNLRNSGDVPFENMVDHFKIYDQPRRPEVKVEVEVDEAAKYRDYMLSGLMHIPSGRLDAFYSVRLSPLMQASMSAIAESKVPSGNPALDSSMGTGNLLLMLQRDTGRWSTQYSWDSDGGVWGLQVLRNFGKLAGQSEEQSNDGSTESLKRVDEEEAMEGGLRGRLSAGAEVYVGAEKSAGMSVGVRFTTLPDSALSKASTDEIGLSSQTTSHSAIAIHIQPPTTITAIFSPITGHIQTAYTARVSQDLALSSRFLFNINSYDSEWCMGLEWWMRRKPRPVLNDNPVPPHPLTDDLPLDTSSIEAIPLANRGVSFGPIQGVLKASISTSANVALMWQGRMRNTLASLGVSANLSSRSKSIAAVGLELAYFTSED